MSPEVRQKITRQVLEADAKRQGDDTSNSVGSSVTNPSTIQSPTHRREFNRPSGNSHGPNSVIFLGQAIAFAAPNKEALPVPIASFLPQIMLELVGGLSVWSVVDTAAYLCTGNSHFLFHLAKSYPDCIAAIYTSDDYSPIILSGIVRRKNDVVTTALPVAFLFNLDYFTKDGKPAQLMIAGGPDVNVNLILGNPFLQATNMVIDYSEKVAQCRAIWTVHHFPLSFDVPG
jgi:hypothetical protein